ncbi:alpha/beta hydrolase [Paenibacillus naphthalenovorans]|uniref:alpha/beta fold hydrolase n=1 Tax=Paenibacillus naphthalenovorans TaxID=162209 RepID=UPI0010B14D08|nr:alpha/beta hydrolase [Paenibacillus naphthalenovorans]GCL73231.1 alpha/beta hydrolase [Paenibacillus naphthalenovorans]
MQEQGLYDTIGGHRVYYHEAGQGETLLLIHGSGPGVSAWANWRLVYPILSKHYHVYAPDLIGFGSSEKPPSAQYGVDAWVEQLIAFIEAKHIGPTSIVGNSLGGCLALHLAYRRPDLVKKLVLMGSVGVSFPLTEGLDRVWGYTPDPETMRQLIQIFYYDKSFAENSDLVHMRYQATLNEENQSAFASMFPAPRQRHIDAMALTEDQIKRIDCPVLLVHGREDEVIPVEQTSWKLAQLLPNAEFHMFSTCGHWTQIEKTNSFCTLVEYFLQK